MKRYDVNIINNKGREEMKKSVIGIYASTYNIKVSPPFQDKTKWFVVETEEKGVRDFSINRELGIENLARDVILLAEQIKEKRKTNIIEVDYHGPMEQVIEWADGYFGRPAIFAGVMGLRHLNNAEIEKFKEAISKYSKKLEYRLMA